HGLRHRGSSEAPISEFVKTYWRWIRIARACEVIHMNRTIVATVIACAGVLCAGATDRVVAVQKNGGNPLLKEPLRLKQGLIAGVPGTTESVAVFKGIPFATPPVGPARWRAPEPAAGWSGVRKADAFSPSCIQSVVTERKPWTYEFMTHGEISEDCLYL